jgi:hypothetical protein
MPATGEFGPAPPGVDLSENQDVTTISAVTTLMVIGTVAVALRLLARVKAKDVGFAADDYLICAGLVSSYFIDGLPFVCSHGSPVDLVLFLGHGNRLFYRYVGDSCVLY